MNYCLDFNSDTSVSQMAQLYAQRETSKQKIPFALQCFCFCPYVPFVSGPSFIEKLNFLLCD